MRLDKIKIGSAKNHSAHQFRNLKDVTIDFDQDHWITVVIGWNGTGKSNVLEALAVIFRDLIMHKRSPEFAFVLQYRMGDAKNTRHIEIDADPDRTKEPFVIHVADDAEARGSVTHVPHAKGGLEISAKRGTRISINEFFYEENRYLPRFVFSYYSGESTRMQEVFNPYVERYDSDLRGGKDPGLKRLFYAQPDHSQFVLLAFLIQQSDDVRVFLEKHFGIDPIEGIESVLFVIRQPPWKSKATDGDPRFWNARGIVSDFLDRLYNIALAPIEIKRTEPVSLWNRKKLQFKYLYVKDVDALRRLVGTQPAAEFFRDLESTHVSQLIGEVRIRIRLRNRDGSVTFRELSEGEQQLLTVLGLLRFTADNEGLFLLDEPDTHLNPRWCVDYIAYLKQFVSDEVQEEDNSHILLTTHNPLTIAALDKKQVQILRLSQEGEYYKIVAFHPEMDPRGLGYAAIVTSEMFGIASSMDKPTQKLLEKQRLFASKINLTKREQSDLDDINLQLSGLGFHFFHPDDEYSRYLRLRNKTLTESFNASSLSDLAEQVVDLPRKEREALAKKLVKEFIFEASKDPGG